MPKHMIIEIPAFTGMTEEERVTKWVAKWEVHVL